MHIKRLNRPVFKLDDAHPAKRFLSAFMECRSDCVGRELDPPGQVPIDQEWKSASDGRVWTFSAFAYGVLSFDIELDGYLTNAPSLTESEKLDREHLPLHRSLMSECADVARQSGNREILELTDQVLEMLGLWEEYLTYRQEMVSKTRD